MSMESKDHFLHLSNRFHLQITHFAYGTFPSANGVPAAIPVNRLLFCLGSTDHEESYVKDENCYYPMQSGHFYFIPANHVAGVCLSEGMYFVSIQFLLDLYNGLDVFSSVNKILEFEDAAQVKRALEIFKTPGENVWAVKMSGIACDCIGSIFEKLDPVELNLTEITGLSSQSLHLLSASSSICQSIKKLGSATKGLCIEM